MRRTNVWGPPFQCPTRRKCRIVHSPHPKEKRKRAPPAPGGGPGPASGAVFGGADGDALSAPRCLRRIPASLGPRRAPNKARNATTDTIHVRGAGDDPASDPSAWLRRDMSAGRLRFTVAGNGGLDFVPYFEVQEELFEVYPVYE